MSSFVCEVCWTEVFNTEAIQKFWVQESLYFCYSATWAQISQSAENACNWCSFLTSVLPSPETFEWPSTWNPMTALSVSLEKAYLTSNTSPQGLNHCQIDFSSDGSSRDWHAEVDLFVDDTDESAGIVTAQPLQPKVNSAQAFSQTREWLDQCKNHTSCGRMPSCTNLPSRVIEVAPADSLGVPCIRSTKGLKGAYLALSYCWGGNQSYVLTMKNLGSLWQGLEMKRLPRTILDAIEVTKSLGFKYLWVDALCIMQDSVEADAQSDMNEELATMNQVYKNAIMTIVAACAPSIVDGFLRDRPCSEQESFNIPCRRGPEQFFVVHIQEHRMYDDMREPINARAWTFQEQLLSPRLLIYASHTLQWQCRTITCNLGGSYHAPNPSAAPRLPSAQMLLSDGPEQHHKHGSIAPEIPHPVLQHWLRIVTSYSSRKASLPSDKLTAISAIAISYAAVFGPEYLAGIWARSAVQQLCWSRASDRIFCRRPTQYRAPSWSWAALDGTVFFASFLQVNDTSVCVPDHRFEIVKWQTRPEVANLPYGQVKAGDLIVKAALRDATFDPSRSRTIRFDGAADVDMHDVKEDSSPANPGLIQTGQGKSDTAEDNYARRIRCLVLYRNKLSQRPEMGGLMLVEAPERKGLLRRMGAYHSANISIFEGCLLDTVCII